MDTNTTRLVQIVHPVSGRKVALVKEPELVLIDGFDSVYQLGLHAIDSGTSLHDLIRQSLSDTLLAYDAIYNGESEWQLLPAFDHPENPFACLVSGTGLTHKNSALNRQMMHQAADSKPTDSMQMYQWGVEGGFPAKGAIGVQPEWFYKGNGTILKAHNQALEIPVYANDGGEEPEVAGIYIVDRNGSPRRLGFSTGNEFSDHIMEKKNYLYLAPSKLRNCAIGPELVVDVSFDGFTGKVSIDRNGATLWSSALNSGEKNMAHSLGNLEYHHFKYEAHRIPLQAHVHFFGADAFSFGSQVDLKHNDVMEVKWDGLGRPLRNRLTIAEGDETLIYIRSIL